MLYSTEKKEETLAAVEDDTINCARRLSIGELEGDGGDEGGEVCYVFV